MGLSFEDIDKYEDSIQDYLDEKLKGDALKNFENKLQQHPDLGEEVDLRRKLRFVFQHEKSIQLDNTLQDIIAKTPLKPDLSDTNEQPPSSDNKNRWWKWGLFAGVLMAFLAGGIYTLMDSPQDYAPVARSYLEPFENIINLGADERSPLNAGMKAYNDKEYTDAIFYLQSHAHNNPGDMANLYLGIAYLMEGKPAKAIPVLENLKQLDDPLFSSKVNWYLGLAYLMGGQEDAFRKLNKDQQNTVAAILDAAAKNH